MTVLRERLAQMDKNDPVTAALVAVADAAADYIDCPLCGLAGGEHFAGEDMGGQACPMARLAAALGVSR